MDQIGRAQPCRAQGGELLQSLRRGDRGADVTSGGALCGGEGRWEGVILGDRRPAVPVIQAQGPEAGPALLLESMQAGAAVGLLGGGLGAGG